MSPDDGYRPVIAVRRLRQGSLNPDGLTMLGSRDLQPFQTEGSIVVPQ